jgi:hypothetical protein
MGTGDMKKRKRKQKFWNEKHDHWFKNTVKNKSDTLFLKSRGERERPISVIVEFG